MSHKDYISGVKPKLDYEVYLGKDKVYDIFQHDKNYRDLENSFESIRRSLIKNLDLREFLLKKC